MQLEVALGGMLAGLAHEPARISSPWLLNSSPARRSTAARSEYGSAAHSRCASCARRRARSTSSGVAAPTRPSSAPVAGSITS